MTGRTLARFMRVYVDGYDLSGYGRSIGPLRAEWDLADLTAPMSDAVMGYLPNHLSISPGTFNGVLQATTDSGTEISAIQLPGVQRDIMVLIGDKAAPVMGDRAFVAKTSHSGFHVVENGGAIYITADFDEYDAADSISYARPWGRCLHPYGAETGANSSTTDTVDINTGCYGGYMAWQVFGGDIAGTLTLQDSADNVDGNFVNHDGLTASVDGASPGGGIVQATDSTEIVNRYMRWQLSVDSGSSLTFALAFVRGVK
jgi:hypothetical protein